MPLDLARIQAICFDVDGTLSDTDDVWVSGLENRLKPLRGLFPRREVRPIARWLVMASETPGNVVYELLDRLGLDDEVGRLVSAMSRWKKEKIHPLWLVPRVSEMLHLLYGRFPLSVVSARGEHSTMQFLQQHQIFPLFHAVATAQTCHYTKPFPDPILWAAQSMGVDPQNCLMVGDTTVDIRAGKAAGAQTVGVLCGFGSERELRRAGADLILPTTADLADILIKS